LLTNINDFYFSFVKREEILAFCASNPEVLVYVLSLESQIKELTERLQTLEARLNQNSVTAVDLLQLISLSKRNPIPGVSAKIMVENLEVKKVIKGNS